MKGRSMNEISAMDWEKAKRRLSEAIKGYEEIRNRPHVNVEFALGWIKPLVIRLDEGERTQELYQEIMSIDI